MRLQVKGINDGIMMVLPNGSWQECCQAVQDTVNEKKNFFSGASLYLEAGSKDIRVVEITALRDQLESNGVMLKGIFGGSEKARQNIRSLGLLNTPMPIQKTARKREIEKEQKHDGGEEAFFYNRNVRSGVVITNKETVIVVGDVNPGAEVKSEKNVIVWGKIRGKVSAGTPDGESAFVRTLCLEDAQITVNGKMAFFAKTKKKKDHLIPLTITVENGEINIDSE